MGCFFAALTLLFFGTAASVHAEAIDTYHTTITVRPSGTLHVRETIIYDFGDRSRHGIFRDIPLTIKTRRYGREIPLGLSRFSVKMDGHLVPHTERTVASKTAEKLVRYRIGDPRRSVTARHTYTLEYDVRQGVLPSALSGMEAIRWNAVGAGSRVPTRHAVAELILPPSLDQETVRIAVYTGTYGSTDARADYRWIDRHRVRFEATQLAPHEALTVEANYPEGLLEGRAPESAGGFGKLLERWHWGAGMAFLWFIWQLAGRYGAQDRITSYPPQYYPPKDLSLLQSGLIFDKFADKKDLSAAILELAALGYLTIEFDGTILRRTDKPAEKGALSADQFALLTRVLFPKKETYRIRANDARRSEELNRRLEDLNATLYTWSSAQGYMHEDPRQARKDFLIRGGTVGTVIAALALYATYRTVHPQAAFVIPFMALFLGVGLRLLIGSISRRALAGILFSLLWLSVSSVSFGAFLSSMPDPIRLLTSPAILLPIVGGALWYFYRRIGRFTPKGLRAYQYLLGYSDFMKRVEKDRIQRFLRQDPHYLDRGLPYAVLFGHNRHWIKFYDIWDVPQPVWYYGDIHRMNDFAHAVESQMSPPASESGGFSGGGGFAGGGGGGGGVGSW